MLIVGLIPLILLCLNIISVGFWKGSLVAYITAHLSKKGKESYDRVFMMASLSLLSLCFLYILVFRSGIISIWEIMALFIIFLLIFIFVTNKIHNKYFLNLNFFKIKALNYILSGILVPYIFIFTWIRMIFVLLGY